MIAHSKINLGLEVLHKRTDGYHEINTVFYRVREPHDELQITRGGFFRFTLSGAELPADESNLVLRAAHAFERWTERPLPPVHMHLHKQIPMGAGLGGGSSDAAAMFAFLSEEHRLNEAERRELIRFSANTGADVPFFLSGSRAAVAHGIGEILEPIALEIPASILIVIDPGIQSSTREAYAALSPEVGRRGTNYAEFFRKPPALRQWREHLCNDFEPDVFRRYPKLAQIKQQLYREGAAFALLSGSGSALFGLFEDTQKGEHAKHTFEAEGLLAWLS